MEGLEKTLYQEITKQIAKAKLLGCDTAHFEEQIEKLGPVSVMKQLSRRGQTSDLFDSLDELHHLELSPEAIVSSSKYASLFTDKEADHFLAVLCEKGYW